MTGDLNEYNLAGLERVLIAPQIGVTVGDVVRLKVTEAVVLANNIEWMATEFTQGTAYYGEKLVNEDGDNAWDVTVAILRPKGEYEWLAKLQEGYMLKFVADVVDMNGHRRLVGNEREALTFGIAYDTKRWFGERNEELITLSGRLRERPPFYEPATSGSGSGS